MDMTFSACRRWVEHASLGTRITLGVLLLFSLAILAQVYFIEVTERDRGLVELQGRLTARSTFKAEELGHAIVNLRRDVFFLSNTPPVQGIIRAPLNRGVDPHKHNKLEVWKNQLTEILVGFVNATPEYYQARFIGVADGGRELVRADYVDGHAVATPQDKLQQKGGRDYFQATLQFKPGEVYLSEINLNREHGQIEVPYRRTIRASIPIYAPEGKLFGMVVINMNIGPTLDKLTEGMPKDYRAYLLNQNGDFLTHPDPDRTFGFDLGKRFRWQDNVTATHTSGKQAVEASERLQSFLLSGEKLYGAERELHFDPQQPRRFMTLIYAIPVAAIDQQIANMRNVAIASALAVAVIIAVLLLLYVRRTLPPLRQLTLAADAVGEGRYETSLAEIRAGEVGALATAFRSMLARISERDQEIKHSNDELARSEAYANLIIDSVPEVILVVDANGRITRANSRMEQIFGYRQEELLDQPVEILIPARFRAHHPGLRQGYATAASQRMMGQGRELFGLHKDGHEIPVEVGLAPLMSGEAQYVIVSIADISARKAADQALRESEERFRLLTANVKDYAIIMLDTLGRVMTWNEGAQQLKGYAGEEIVGQSMAHFYTSEANAAGKPAALLKEAESIGRAEDEDWRVRKDGSCFYADVVLTAMRNPAGELIGFAKITRDISERKAAEAEIRSLNANLEQQVADRTAELQGANRELESFAYAIAHDLRAPLRAMSGFSQALMEDYGEGLDREAKIYLDQIIIGSTHMGALVDGLLTLSRSTRGELQRDAVDLSALSERILAEMAQTEPGRGVAWEVEPELVARGDGRMLEAVMRNLLGNAWKYTAGTLEAKIRVYADKNGRESLFCVSDNGAGFDMAHAGKLFKPFQRLHRQEEFVGIGIGLATVQRIVHRHGGEIHAEAAPGQGAKFCFSLRHAAAVLLEEEKGTAS